MKKIIALVLAVLCMLTVLGGCGSSSYENLMPYGLEFGMTYEEVKALDTNAQELEDADSNDGYVCGLHVAEQALIDEFYGVDFGENGDFALWFPEYAYSFNQDKELYEYYILSSISSESWAESVYNSFVSYFSGIIDSEPTTTETDSELSSVFETDEIRVGISLTSDSDGFMFTLVLHDYTHDLES